MIYNLRGGLVFRWAWLWAGWPDAGADLVHVLDAGGGREILDPLREPGVERRSAHTSRGAGAAPPTAPHRLYLQLSAQPCLDLVKAEALAVPGLEVAILDDVREVALPGRDHGGDSALHLREASHLETAGGLEEAGEVLLGHCHLAPVHEDQQQLHVLEGNIFQHNDRMFARIS